MMLFSIALEGDEPLEEYAKYTSLLEKHRFHAMHIYEHIPYRSAWAITFYTARYTKNLLLGPVTIPVFLQQPITIARNLAALNEITDGRGMVGISRGAFHEVLGSSVERSVDAVRNAITSIVKFLGPDPQFPAAERTANLSNARYEPRIYVGTSGPKLIQAAASLRVVKGIVTDNLWNPDFVGFIKRNIDAGAWTGKRDASEVKIIPRPFCSISENPEEARKRAIGALKSHFGQLVGKSPMLEAAGIKYDELRQLDTDTELQEKILEKFVAIGTPEEIVEQSHRMVKAGVSEVCFGYPLGKERTRAISLLAEKVKPTFEE